MPRHRYEVDAWYFSPYPDAFAQQNKLYVCEYTLKYMKRRSAYERHRAGLKQSAKRPPGKLIYTDAAPPLSSSCVEQGMVQPKQLTCFEVGRRPRSRTLATFVGRLFAELAFPSS